jgi:hypothetical protein
MFVEDTPTATETPRALVSRLMAELDDRAAREGHRVAGDVTILEYPKSVFEFAPKIRLEADVQPAV